MTKKYIKNCTGEHCRLDEKPSGIVSAVVFYFLLLCFLSVSVYVLFFSEYLMISNVSIAGTQQLSDREVRQSFDDLLNGKFLNIFPRNNFLLVSKQSIEKKLYRDFKKIRGVVVDKKFPDSVSIAIDERKALLVWCSQEKCYLLDEQGFAYSEADFSSEQLIQNNLLQINDNSGSKIEIGEKIIEPSFEQYVLALKDDLLKFGFEANGQYYTPSRMSEEIIVKTNQETDFYFSMQFSKESAMKTLGTIFKKEITTEKRGNIAYIDLRNENKVFYKLKIIESVSSSEQSSIVSIKKDEKKK